MLVSVGTSIGRDPYDDEWRLQPDSLLNSGSVVARLYEDRNHNGEMDRQDRPIEDVTFKAKHGADQPTTDEGVAVLRGIASHRYVDVEMQRDTLESPFALPAQEAITAVVRPGKVLRVDFPVVMAGEVEGTLYEATGDGRKPAAGIELELVNEAGEVVAESTTAFDGFYLFNLVPPGQYHVRIAPEQAEAAGLELSESPAVVVEGAGSITYVDDVHARVVSPAPAGESSPERMASSK